MSKVKKISENIVEIDGERFVKEDSKGWLDIPELGISVEIVKLTPKESDTEKKIEEIIG